MWLGSGLGVEAAVVVVIGVVIEVVGIIGVVGAIVMAGIWLLTQLEKSICKRINNRSCQINGLFVLPFNISIHLFLK